MTRTITIVALAAVIVLSASAVNAQNSNAKYNTGRYRPSKPALSPYLNYFRTDVGVTDSYNALVRPRQQLRNEMTRQDNNIRNLNKRANTLSHTQQTIRQSQVAPTGTGSTFMNYSHYYNIGNRRR